MRGGGGLVRHGLDAIARTQRSTVWSVERTNVSLSVSIFFSFAVRQAVRLSFGFDCLCFLRDGEKSRIERCGRVAVRVTKLGPAQSVDGSTHVRYQFRGYPTKSDCVPNAIFRGCSRLGVQPMVCGGIVASPPVPPNRRSELVACTRKKGLVLLEGAGLIGRGWSYWKGLVLLEGAGLIRPQVCSVPRGRPSASLAPGATLRIGRGFSDCRSRWRWGSALRWLGGPSQGIWRLCVPLG